MRVIILTAVTPTLRRFNAQALEPASRTGKVPPLKSLMEGRGAPLAWVEPLSLAMSADLEAGGFQSDSATHLRHVKNASRFPLSALPDLIQPPSMSLLEKAIALAVAAHHGQQDRYGRPYILHPLRVMGRVKTDDEKIAAILHDVVEDTPWTIEKLAAEGFPQHLLDALDCVTKRDGEPYDKYIERSASNPLAARVKLADLEDNMDITRLNEVTDKDRSRLSRYLAAYHRLLQS